MRKAFDRVWHSGLFAKLSKVGIAGGPSRWFEDYVSNRQQRVVINGQTSEWGDTLAGVPQGSVLGPPKIKSVLLTKKKVNDPIPLVMVDWSVVEDATSHKHLGVTLSKDQN